ncbi:uncharacterized protein LOC134413307 [Elgaria multicarinata webbii]|uniref:uncharacterized protein LOC134413307 n=1 Tax=Elgaria multicarinata webbii TaxID=159646 RepID=UPI002FCD0008
MWKMLGLLLICALLSPSQGKTPAIRSIYNRAATHNIMLSGTLHDGLLQNLLKERIVLPDINIGGLLGPGGKISGIKIASVQLTGYSLVFRPEINGGDVIADIKLEITGNALLGASSLIKISLELKSKVTAGLANFSEGTYDVIIHGCDCQFGAIDISILRSSLPASVLSTIRESITSNIDRQICPVMTVVLNGVKQLVLATINVDLPFGSYGTLKYQLAELPTITDTFVEFDISADFELAEGGLLSIPNDTVFINLPSIQSYSYFQSLHPAFLNMVMSVIGNMEPQEFNCTLDAGSTIKWKVLYLKLLHLHGHLVNAANDKAVAQVAVQTEVFSNNGNESSSPILIMRDSMNLTTAFSVLDGRLALALSMDSQDQQLDSSSVGISKGPSFVPHCNSLLEERILSLLNGRLRDGIPVPSILGTGWVNASASVVEGALVLCV